MDLTKDEIESLLNFIELEFIPSVGMMLIATICNRINYGTTDVVLMVDIENAPTIIEAEVSNNA